jgi:hypothetical protein
MGRASSDRLVAAWCVGLLAILAGQAALAADGASDGMADDRRAAWIVDDFEDGNIDGWVDEGGGYCTASTSVIAANGTLYSMRVDGACGHFDGKVLDIPTSMPTGVNFWVRANTVDTHDTYFILGDQDSGSGGNVGAIYFKGSPDGTWTVFNGAGHSCGPRNPDQWYRIHINVDWPCKMFDVSVDGDLKQTNVDFYHLDTASIDRIHVYNWSPTTGRYDEISFSTPGVSPLVFEDDFERGSTCRWSVTVS